MSADDQGVVTYLEADKQHIAVFASGAGHHLPVNHWDGAQWTWSDHWSAQDGPLGTDVGGAPGIITYREGTQPRQIYAFVRMAVGSLNVNHWDGSQWKWAAQGMPPGTQAHPGLGVITYREGTEPQRIYCFVTGYDGRLHVNYRAGSQWRWANLGMPPGAIVTSEPGVVTYQEVKESKRTQRIYAFVNGDYGHLHVNLWDGSEWKWSDQGPPAIGKKVSRGPGVITYQEDTEPRRIYAFVGSADGHLHVNYWDGLQWNWADQGTPSGATVESKPGVITYREGTQPQRIYAFVKGTDGHLHVNYWKGLHWKWADHGTPPGTTVHSAPAVITYRERTGPQRLEVFVRGADGHLHRNSWNGSEWKWADQGFVAQLPVSV